MKRFIPLLLISLLMFTFLPFAHATSINVQYTTNDNSNLANVILKYADGAMDGTIYGSPTWQAPNGLVFDGSAGPYVSFGNKFDLHTFPAWTIVVACKVDSTAAYSGLVTNWRGANQFLLGQADDPSHMSMFLKDANDTNALINTGGMTLHKNYIFIATYSSHKISFYENGTLQGWKIVYNVKTDSTDGEIASYSGAGGSFNGIVYYVGIWTRAFTPTEISSTNTLTLPIFDYTSIKGLFKMNEGSGAKVYGYDESATFNTHSTPQSLTISQTASAVNSSLFWSNLPFSNSTDIFNATSYSWRVNGTSTQTLALNHYIYLTFSVSPSGAGLVNTTAQWRKTLTSITISVTAYPQSYFTGWYSGGTFLSGANPYTYIVTSKIVTATFGTSAPTTEEMIMPFQEWIGLGLILLLFFASLAFRGVLGYMLNFFSLILSLLIGLNGSWTYTIAQWNSTSLSYQSFNVVQNLPSWWAYVLIFFVFMNVLALIFRFIGGRDVD